MKEFKTMSIVTTKMGDDSRIAYVLGKINDNKKIVINIDSRKTGDLNAQLSRIFKVIETYNPDKIFIGNLGNKESFYKLLRSNSHISSKIKCDIQDIKLDKSEINKLSLNLRDSLDIHSIYLESENEKFEITKILDFKYMYMLEDVLLVAEKSTNRIDRGLALAIFSEYSKIPEVKVEKKVPKKKVESKPAKKAVKKVVKKTAKKKKND